MFSPKINKSVFQHEHALDDVAVPLPDYYAGENFVCVCTNTDADKLMECFQLQYLSRNPRPIKPMKHTHTHPHIPQLSWGVYVSLRSCTKSIPHTNQHKYDF